VAGTGIAGTVFIAAGAFWLSFTSLTHLAVASGIDAHQAWAWPLIVDGIIVVATVSVVAMARRPGVWYPWLLLGAGAGVSVAANAIQAAMSPTVQVPHVMAGAVAAVPPLVLLAITHLTVVLTRPGPTGHARPVEPVPYPAPTFALHAPQATGLSGFEPPLRPVAEPPLFRGQPQGPSPSEMRGPAFDRHAVPSPVLASSGEGPGRADTGLGTDPLGAGTADRAAKTAEVRADRQTRARALSAQGRSTRQIADELGVHATTVGRWLATLEPAASPRSPELGDRDA
jgi:hypothetical protein